jgi:hypothetical protein
MLERLQSISLRSNAPPPEGHSAFPPDIEFLGEVLFKIENVWNDEISRGTTEDGAVFDCIALYRKPGKKRLFRRREPDEYYAEVSRSNYMPLLKFREIRGLDPIPYFSYAKRFASIDQAAKWLLSQELASDAGLREQLEKQINPLIT